MQTLGTGLCDSPLRFRRQSLSLKNKCFLQVNSRTTFKDFVQKDIEVLRFDVGFAVLIFDSFAL